MDHTSHPYAGGRDADMCAVSLSFRISEHRHVKASGVSDALSQLSNATRSVIAEAVKTNIPDTVEVLNQWACEDTESGRRVLNAEVECRWSDVRAILVLCYEMTCSKA